MNRESFSIFDSKIRPRMIIEASAGTGKTYTIVGLIIRLLLENKIPVDKLLIVTFTRMATRELKDRILRRLKDVYQVLNDGAGEKSADPFLAAVATLGRGNPEALLLIRQAMTNFDDANIYTIHGFCQQVLAEETLLTGSPPDMEITQTDDLLVESAEDFWRNLVSDHSGNDAGRYFLSKIMKFGETPGELLKTIQPLIGHLSAEPESCPEIRNPVELLEPVLETRLKMQKSWMIEKETIIRELLDSDVKRMTANNVDKRVKAMEEFLQDPVFTRDTFDKLEYFRPGYHSENLKKNGTNLPDHSFFELCEEYLTCTDRVQRVQAWFLKWAAGEIWKLRESKREESSVYTYDDLLNAVHNALCASVSGKRLAQRLREKYPVALVDEFQDTDSIQYDILDKIYPNQGEETALLMIGDPKQAIYSFRGADLYSYLKARNRIEPDSVYTLRHNFRSTPRFIAACNKLFDRSHESPFLETEIPYIRISPGGNLSDSDYQYRDETVVPVPVYYLNRSEGKEKLKKVIFDEMARQIRDMIIEGRDGRIQMRVDDSGDQTKRNLQSGDITVLVHSNKDALRVKRSLQQYGVGAVIYSREKVFNTREAKRLEQLFTAVLEPSNPSKVMTALSTGFFGHKLSMLYRVQSDENELSGITEQFHKLQDTWQRSGVYSMIRNILFELNGLVKLSELTDSERIISNIQQLLEIASAAEQEQHFKPPGLLRWFRKKIANAADDEEETLQLESDENLVKVSTIHNSKGLEFPVVFCPTLWEGKNLSRRKPELSAYHTEEDPYDMRVNLDQSDSPGRTKAHQKSMFEEIAEDVRKTYVALTRARYECRIFWTDYSWSNISGLGAMLSGKENVIEYIRDNVSVKHKNGLSPNVLRDKLISLSRENPQLFSFEEMDPGHTQAEKLTRQHVSDHLQKLIYKGPSTLTPAKKLFSFSSLQRNESDAHAEPDYDQELDQLTRKIRPVEPEQPAEADIFQFPRGKRAGTFIHKLFEHENFDFRRPDGYESIVHELLDDYGFDSRWTTTLVDMLKDVSNADYGSLQLNRAEPDELLKEMQFHFPAYGPSYESVSGIVRGHPVPPPDDKAGRDFMTGFIDLILRQDDVYYLIDYKSNFLGNGIEDYHPGKLHDEMEQAGYDIQYHIYTVAMLKYLRQRIPGFDYRRDFGGVYYLFVRGIRRDSESGIYFRKPGLNTIHQLEKELRR